MFLVRGLCDWSGEGKVYSSGLHQSTWLLSGDQRTTSAPNQIGEPPLMYFHCPQDRDWGYGPIKKCLIIYIKYVCHAGSFLLLYLLDPSCI